MARRTGWLTIASIVAVVTPAATLITSASGARSPASAASVSGTIAGLTPMMTTEAPRTARALPSGVVSRATESTPGRRTSAAFASVRLVTRISPSTVTPGASSPPRIAPPIAPAPMIAIEPSVLMRSS